MKIKISKKWKNLLYLLPSLTGVLIFYLIPFADVLHRSLLDDMGRSFVGLSNYSKLLHSSNFLLAGQNTLVFMACSTPLLLALTLCTAILLQPVGPNKIRHVHADRTRRSKLTLLYLLPLAIPVAALTGVWKIFFSRYGLLNTLLHFFGMSEIDWLNSNYSMIIAVVTYLWRNFGYTMILWMAGLSAISPELYEAAAMEGAGARQQFFYITIPLLKPLGFTVSVLAVLNTFKVFRDLYLICGDYPNKSIYMVQHILNNWFTNMEFGKITAAALVIIFIAGWLVLGLQIGFSWQKRRNYYV